MGAQNNIDEIILKNVGKMDSLLKQGGQILVIKIILNYLKLMGGKVL